MTVFLQILLKYTHRTALSVILTLLFSDIAAAQFRDRLTEDSIRRRLEIYRSWTYLKAKDEEANEPGGAWLLMGAAGAGYDSNIFESFENEQSSAILDGILRAEHWRYFSDKDQFRIRIDTPFRIHTADTPEGSVFRGPDQFEPRVMAEWRRTENDAWRFGVWTEFKFENDGVVNTEGFSPIRDFEHIQFTAKPWVEYNFGDHSITLEYQGRYRDYVPTAGLPALDFWRYGPNVAAEFQTSSTTTVELRYQFRVEDYRANPARDAFGDLVETTPFEEHHFHRASIEARWRAAPNLNQSFSFAFIRKDDQFQDFESFDDHLFWSRTEWYALPRLKLGLMAAYEIRDYDRRPAGDGSRLEHDRVFLLPSMRYELNDSLALFSYYMFNSRDSNRTFGRDFRDFEINRFLTGISFAL